MKQRKKKARTKPAPVVLGVELALAETHEAQRLAAGNERRSPMPRAEYDFWRGDHDLHNVQPLKLDAHLARLTRTYADSDSRTRRAMRGSIAMDEFYTLMTFAERAAVFALRHAEERSLIDGLHAVAMIEVDRVDARDISVPLALLHYAAKRINCDAAKLFRRAARLAELRVAKWIANFLKQPPKYHDLRDSWGYVEIETAAGIGFLGWGFRKKYRPTCNLAQAILAIAELIDRDQYKTNSVSIGEDLPRVWLSKRPDAPLDAAMRRIRACASFHAELQTKSRSHEFSRHGIIAFLVEASDSLTATTLANRAGRYSRDSHSALIVTIGNLFCLLIAESFVVGVESVETPESLARFTTPIAKILTRAWETSPSRRDVSRG